MRQRAAMRLKIILLKLAVMVYPLPVKYQNNLMTQMNRIRKVLFKARRDLVDSKIISQRRLFKKCQKYFQDPQW